MEQFLFTVHAISVIILFSIVLAAYYFQFARHKKTEISGLITLTVVMLTYGILYDAIRVIAFQVIGFIEYIDQLCFFLEIMLYFFAISVIFRIVGILCKQSGHPIKYKRFLRYVFLALAAILSAANVYLFQQAPVGEIGFYTYQLHFYLKIIFLSVYFPFLGFLVTRIRIFYKEIKDKSLKRQTFLSLIFYGLLIVERFLNNSIYGSMIVPQSITNYIFIINLWGLILLAIGAVWLFLKNKDLLDNISSYFCVKGVYLIKKDAGYVLYGYNFQTLTRNELISRDQMLLGAFIQAITTGLRVTLNLEGDIQVLQVGNDFIYFSHGKYLFGVVFSTDANPRIGNKLENFLDKFEAEFGDYLEKWNGLFVNFQSETVEKWLLKCFR